MKQTKWESLLEQLLNIGSGLFLSALVTQPIIFPWFGIVMTTSDNIVLATIFTLTSIARGYLWRRYFNLKDYCIIFGQTRWQSFIEQTINIISGLLLSVFIVQPLSFPLFDIVTTSSQNFQMALIFTLISIARSYVWRRYFNKKLHLKVNYDK